MGRRAVLTYGVDVGLNGAIAVCVGRELARVADMPTVLVGGGKVTRQVDPAGVAALIRRWRVELGHDFEHAVIERVAARPGQGVASVFSFGHSAGIVAGVLAALQIPVEYVGPQAWKRSYRIGPDKSSSRAKASELFPAHAGQWLRVKDDGRAEAALIALYGHRTTA